LVKHRDATSVGAICKHAVSNFCSTAAEHQALQKAHEINVPQTTKHTEYKNTQTARLNAVNRHAKNGNGVSLPLK
jgi:hypothetical protein